MLAKIHRCKRLSGHFLAAVFFFAPYGTSCWCCLHQTSGASFVLPSGWLPSSWETGFPCVPRQSHPSWPIWGSVIHHTAGGHVLWKGRELVTSLGPPACVSNPFFFSCLPSAWPWPSQDCGCIEIIGLYSERPGCQCSFRIEILSLVPQVPSDLPFRAPSSASACLPLRLRPVTIMTPASQYNDMTSMVHYLQWVSWPGALCIDYSSLLCCLADLWVQPAQRGTHSKLQPQGAFIPLAEFNHFPLSLASFCLSAELFRV